MKETLSILILILATNLGFSQRQSFTIDTIYGSKDSTVVFVQKYIDSTLMKSFYGMFTDSTDSEFRYGFLRMKKGLMREYKIGVRWDEKEYDWRSKHPGYRGLEGEVIILKRIE
jgi:hypothetical protein